MNEIHVRSQEELDVIPLDYNGTIFIEFGNAYIPAKVKNNYTNAKFKAYGSVTVDVHGSASISACDSVTVVAHDSAIVNAHNSAIVNAHDSAIVNAYDSATIFAHDAVEVLVYDSVKVIACNLALVFAYDSATIFAYDSVKVNAHESAMVCAYDSATVEAYGSATVEAYGSATVDAYNSARVNAYGSAMVDAYGSATVEAYGSATVEAYEFSQVLDRTNNHNITAKGDARIVYDPKTIDDYIRHYVIESDGKTCRLFKAVHKRDGKYFANWNGYEYELGKTATADGLDTNVREDCGKGIHLSHLRYAIEFGKKWNDLAILELEAENDKIIVPLGNPGKVRTLEVKVIREVPRDEWGNIYRID